MADDVGADLGLKWTKDPDTGLRLPIERDDRWIAAIRQFHASECSHPDSEPMRVRIANAQPQVVRCCKTCGARTSSPLKQDDKQWVAALPFRPDELAEEYQAERTAAWRRTILGVARAQLAERGRFTRDYQAYMNSPEWAKRREKVLRRCGGNCEGCGEARAVEAHHLSYRHFKAEFLFELVGLCHQCHERWHADMLDEEDEPITTLG